MAAKCNVKYRTISHIANSNPGPLKLAVGIVENDAADMATYGGKKNTQTAISL
jgi:hypothetical protein